MAELKTKRTEASVDAFIARIPDPTKREDCPTLEGDWFLTGFAPRKQDLTLYLMGCRELHPDQLAKLGKYKTGKSRLYIKRLSDVDLAVLRKLVASGVEHVKRTYG